MLHNTLPHQVSNYHYVMQRYQLEYPTQQVDHGASMTTLTLVPELAWSERVWISLQATALRNRETLLNVQLGQDFSLKKKKYKKPYTKLPWLKNSSKPQVFPPATIDTSKLSDYALKNNRVCISS